jgi:FkbM family methyltransferase
VGVRERAAWRRRRFARTWRASSAVRPRAAFVARELTGRETTREYRLRRSSLRAAIRHPLVDVAVLDEVLVAEDYAIPAHVAQRLRELGRPPRVLDIGANIGLFSLYVHRHLPGARLVSFEPDPRNLAVLRRCVAANPGLDWEVVPAAAGTRDGSAELISDFAGSQMWAVAHARGGHLSPAQWMPPHVRARYPASPRVVVEVRDVYPALAACDLVKMDVEGAEWELLADPRFAATTALAMVVEVHPRPGGRREALGAFEHAVRRAGMTWAGDWTDSDEAAVVWAWRDGPR